VTYCTLEAAEKAQRSLHGNKVLPGMSRPIQVKPANSDDAAKLERKVFIGMVSKQATEDDLNGMFGTYGEVEDLSILKDSDGNSKGCAFIKFKSAKDCHKAIRSMHHSLTMQGCSSPIVVKWADTDKERVVRRHQKLTDSFVPAGEMGRGPGTAPYAHNMPNMNKMGGFNMMSMSQQATQNPPPPPAYNNNSSALITAITPLLHNLAAQSNPDTNKALVNALIAALQALANCNNTTGNSRALTDIANLLNATVTPGSNQDILQQPQYNMNKGPDMSSTFSQPSSYNSIMPPGYNSSMSSNNMAGNNVQQLNRQSEGPDGANLFIYHIPSELRDHDLSEMFSTFGSILSCKIFIDKATNQSKCFGFVSFDNPNSAQLAITAMNGFKIGSKRLKVQLKKPKDSAKPF